MFIKDTRENDHVIVLHVSHKEIYLCKFCDVVSGPSSLKRTFAAWIEPLCGKAYEAVVA